MRNNSKLWSTLAIFTLPQEINPDQVSYWFLSVRGWLLFKYRSDNAAVSLPAHTHDCLKGGSQQTAEWDGGESITSDFTLACDSSACLAGDGVVDYTRQVRDRATSRVDAELRGAVRRRESPQITATHHRSTLLLWQQYLKGSAHVLSDSALNQWKMISFSLWCHLMRLC